MEIHCQERQYSFQIKKCMSCWYCTINPPRTEEALHFLPDPTLNQDKDEWKPFAELYGSVTTDSDRPSLKEKTVSGAETDKDFKGLFVAAKVRDYIICGECGKRRVVYCKQKMTKQQQTALDRVQEELSYTCGSQLFPEEHQLHSLLRVREALSCQSPLEITYYADVTHRFTPVCYYCGDDDALSNSAVVQQLQTQYSIVRPLCDPCEMY